MTGLVVTTDAVEFVLGNKPWEAPRLHTWLSRYRADGVAGLADRSRRLQSCQRQVSPEVEAAVCEPRREHLHWCERQLVHKTGQVQSVVPPMLGFEPATL